MKIKQRIYSTHHKLHIYFNTKKGIKTELYSHIEIPMAAKLYETRLKDSMQFSNAFCIYIYIYIYILVYNIFKKFILKQNILPVYFVIKKIATKIIFSFRIHYLANHGIQVCKYDF